MCCEENTFHVVGICKSCGAEYTEAELSGRMRGKLLTAPSQSRTVLRHLLSAKLYSSHASDGADVHKPKQVFRGCW